MDLLNIALDLEHDEDDWYIYEFIRFGIPRQLYERNNWFDDLCDVAFRKRFRISRECTLDILRQIENQLEYPYDSNNCVSPMNQLLTCLRFYSTGGHLQLVADFMNMHVSTACRIIHRVSEAIAELYPQYIGIPQNRQQVQVVQQNFFNIAGFPKVIGTVDCTHIKIQSPGGEDGELFRNRKGYFSINTQVICDASLKMMNVVARWPGSAHDATIFNHSTVRGNFERNLYRNCLLLGDSGYPCKSYLFTPLLNPETLAQQRYNESHIRTRNTVERCFGVLKRRFPILAYGSRLKVENTLTIIAAVSVLHNTAMAMNDLNLPPLPEEIEDHILEHLIQAGQIPDINVQNNEPVGAGQLLRQQFIQQYFSHL
ncbi:hypothetical protein MML48_9g00003661 [Holotrichia oblita]|uniref:Uncharacterized protein n=1 Tax=Holotrichia oblita TaxID=644536 RepID=A0ACB9SL53_HOLOL|nr:hypothetical protein MML48_9g00003661 [Holotrichia oblita]